MNMLIFALVFMPTPKVTAVWGRLWTLDFRMVHPQDA